MYHFLVPWAEAVGQQSWMGLTLRFQPSMFLMGSGTEIVVVKRWMQNKDKLLMCFFLVIRRTGNIYDLNTTCQCGLVMPLFWVHVENVGTALLCGHTR